MRFQVLKQVLELAHVNMHACRFVHSSSESSYHISNVRMAGYLQIDHPSETDA